MTNVFRHVVFGGLVAASVIVAPVGSAAAGAPAAPAATLVDAVRAGDTPRVRALLRQKIDVNRPAADGSTAAARRGGT